MRGVKEGVRVRMPSSGFEGRGGVSVAVRVTWIRVEPWWRRVCIVDVDGVVLVVGDVFWGEVEEEEGKEM